MMQSLPQNLTRRAKLSTGAILAAIVLTIAALIALSAAIGRHEIGGYEIQNPVSPVSDWKAAPSQAGLALARN
jgi:hypothetical protein